MLRPTVTYIPRHGKAAIMYTRNTRSPLRERTEGEGKDTEVGERTSNEIMTLCPPPKGFTRNKTNAM